MMTRILSEGAVMDQDQLIAMIKSLRRAALVPQVGMVAIALATLCNAALPQACFAQVAGGSEAGGGAPPGPDSALLNAAPAPEPRQCIRRNADLINSNENRLSVWVTVRQPAVADIQVNGSAIDPRTGTLAISLLSNGITVASSPEVQGYGAILTTASARTKLFPGQQYKITAKATVSKKKHVLLHMSVAVGGTCP